MKIIKTISNVWAGLAVVCLIACSSGGGDDKADITPFSVTPLTVTLNDEGVATVSIKSGTDWNVSTFTESWLTATPVNGHGNATITLKALGENITRQARTAQVVIIESGTAQSAVVNVTQQPPTPRLLADRSTLSFTSSAGEETVNVSSNQSWTVESSASWCTVTPRMGAGNGSLTVKVTQNASLTSRTATITVKSVDTSLQPVTVQVSQEGVAFTISPLNVTLSDALSSTITIATTSDWYVSNVSENWLTVTPVSGRGNGTVTLKAVGLNNTGATRTARVEIVEGSASLTQTVNVSQLPAPPTLQADASSLSFTCNEGGKTVMITSNVSWTATSNVSWCTVSPHAGTGNGSLQVTVTTNEALTPRTATITITPGNSSLAPLTLQVTQQEYVEVKPGEGDNTTPQYSRKQQ